MAAMIGMKERLQQLDERLKSMPKQFERLEVWFDKIDARFDQLMEFLEAKFSDVVDSGNRMERNMDLKIDDTRSMQDSVEVLPVSELMIGENILGGVESPFTEYGKVGVPQVNLSHLEELKPRRGGITKALEVTLSNFEGPKVGKILSENYKIEKAEMAVQVAFCAVGKGSLPIPTFKDDKIGEDGRVLHTVVAEMNDNYLCMAIGVGLRSYNELNIENSPPLIMHPCLIDGNVSFQSEERKFIQFLLGENIFPTDKPPPLIYDEREVESWDESRSYIFLMIDIVKRWLLASDQQLQGLKNIMVTFMLIPNLTKKQPFNFQVVVLSDISVEDAIKFDDCCRNQQIAFMLRFVSDVKSEEVHSIKKGNCEAIEKHHASIIEWHDKLGSHLQQLAIANRNVGVLMVVVQAKGSKKQMENADQRGARVLIDVLGHETLNQSSLRTRMFSSSGEIGTWMYDLIVYDLIVGIFVRKASRDDFRGCSHFNKQQMLVLLRGSPKRVGSFKLKLTVSNHLIMEKFYLLPMWVSFGSKASMKGKTFSNSVCEETKLCSHLITFQGHKEVISTLKVATEKFILISKVARQVRGGVGVLASFLSSMDMAPTIEASELATLARETNNVQAWQTLARLWSHLIIHVLRHLQVSVTILGLLQLERVKLKNCTSFQVWWSAKECQQKCSAFYFFVKTSTEQSDFYDVQFVCFPVLDC